MSAGFRGDFKGVQQAMPKAKSVAHDLRRTHARLCHNCSGELEEIRFLLGHASVTERYIGNKQKPQDAVTLEELMRYA